MDTKQFCQDLAPIINLIKHGVIPLIQIGIPIILIVLGMLDLGKAVMAGKEDEMKKAQSMLLKRFLYAIAIFFVVTLVTLVFRLVANNSDGDEGAKEAVTWRDCW